MNQVTMQMGQVHSKVKATTGAAGVISAVAVYIGTVLQEHTGMPVELTVSVMTTLGTFVAGWVKTEVIG